MSSTRFQRYHSFPLGQTNCDAPTSICQLRNSLSIHSCADGPTNIRGPLRPRPPGVGGHACISISWICAGVSWKRRPGDPDGVPAPAGSASAAAALRCGVPGRSIDRATLASAIPEAGSRLSRGAGASSASSASSARTSNLAFGSALLEDVPAIGCIT